MALLFYTIKGVNLLLFLRDKQPSEKVSSFQLSPWLFSKAGAIGQMRE